MPSAKQNTATPTEHVSVGDMTIELTRKKIKNVNLRISRDGRILVSAPARVPLSFISEFLLSKKEWIFERQQAVQEKHTVSEHTYHEGELHPFFGKHYPIKRCSAKHPKLSLINNHFILALPDHDISSAEITKFFDNWYRTQIKSILPKLISAWAPIVDAEPNEWGIKKMKTKWGTCNIQDARIWINLELTKYPQVCLEYVLVHELTHLHERYHNKRFYKLMDRSMPDWRDKEKLLETWK